MGWFSRWRLSRAARPYARRLPGQLRRGWGGSKTYTRGQIDAAVRALRLNPRDIFIGYAVFLSLEDLEATGVTDPRFTAAEARAAFGRWKTSSAAWGPNAHSSDGAYASADTGGGHHGGHGDGGGH